jgi:hypothetical protein
MKINNIHEKGSKRRTTAKFVTEKESNAEVSAVDHYSWWFGRKEAAALRGKSERTIYNWGKRGQIETAIVYGRLKYKVDVSPHELATAALPLEKFGPNNTFVAWITFSPDACQNSRKSIEEWCRRLQQMVEEYVKVNITREDVAERQPLRSQLSSKQKYLEVIRIVCPRRKITERVDGAPRYT